MKNVVMVMEWAPKTTDIVLVSPEESRAKALLDKEQQAAFETAYTLLKFQGEVNVHNAPGDLHRDALGNAILAATDLKVDNTTLDAIIKEFGDPGAKRISLAGFKAALTSGRLRQVEKGRYWVMLSLAEAETLRRILHVRKSKPLVSESNSEIALRYSPASAPGAPVVGDSGVIFDSSSGWRKGVVANTRAIAYQCSVVHNLLRLFDCDMHFPDAALNTMIRALQSTSVHERERFFHNNIGCRRRMVQKWQETPLSKVFTVRDEWAVLKHQAYSTFFREAIKARNLTQFEAFSAFDADGNGLLGPAEIYGALRWLGHVSCTTHDVVDFLFAADTNKDGMLDYHEYSAMLRGNKDHTPEEQDEEEEERERGDKNTIAKIEPYGAEALREIIMQRKREALLRAREDKLRRRAYQRTLDMRLFEEELRASEAREGGPNPLVYDDVLKSGSVSVRVTEYRFTTSSSPLRMRCESGGNKFQKLKYAKEAKIVPTCKEGHPYAKSTNGMRGPCSICGSLNHGLFVIKCNGQDCGNNAFVCNSCFETLKEDLEETVTSLQSSETYLQCSKPCAGVSLQVPRAAMGEGGDLDIKNVTLAQFTVSVEIKISKLPIGGEKAALLRFAPNKLSRPRKQKIANIYLDHEGQLQASLTQETKSDIHVKVKVWHLLSVAVDGDKGTVTMYLDGKRCGHVVMHNDNDKEELPLRHSMVLLGGGKWKEAKGGSIRSTMLHNAVLDDLGVSTIWKRSLSRLRAKPVLVILDKTQDKKESNDTKEDLCTVVKAELKTSHPDVEVMHLTKQSLAQQYIDMYPTLVHTVLVVTDVDKTPANKATDAFDQTLTFIKALRKKFKKEKKMLLYSESATLNVDPVKKRQCAKESIPLSCTKDSLLTGLNECLGDARPLPFPSEDTDRSETKDDEDDEEYVSGDGLFGCASPQYSPTSPSYSPTSPPYQPYSAANTINTLNGFSF